jgi:drug/metabolite transporter (DMT)-like permease
MNNDIATPQVNKKNGKVMLGVILLAAGALLLVDQLDAFLIPDWLFSWPMWLIGWGAIMGAKHNFQKPSWIFMMLIGVIFLINDNVHNADNITWPVGLIVLGAWVALRPAKQADREFWENNDKAKQHFNFEEPKTEA